MKKLSIVLLLLASTSAFAFGGGGGGRDRVRERYKAGVDSMRIHINPDEPIDPPVWVDCDEQTETQISGVCCPNEKVYATGTKCCNTDGYEVKDDTCQKSCDEGLVLMGNECVNLCENYTSTKCKPTCDWQTGEGEAGNEGEYCENKTGKCSEGTCEPITCNPCEKLIEGICTPITCDNNMHCDTTQNICICNDEYENIGGTCMKKCPTGITRNTDNSCTVCENGNVYLSYNDDPCGTETPMNTQSCTTGSDCWEGIGDASCCDTTTHTCKAGTYYYDEDSGNVGYRCVEADNKQCTKNSDCASGEFCNLTSSELDCYKPNTGTCEAISSSDYTDATVTGLGSVRRSKDTMTWWAAENWCKAQGKSLIDVSKFKVYKTTDENTAASGLLTSGANTWSFGCADGKKCGYWSNSPYNAMWSGNTLVETAGDSDGFYKDRYSPVLISLRQEFDSNSLYFWTASDSSSDSCYAFYVDLGDGGVYDFARTSNFYALCEKITEGTACGENKVYNAEGNCVCAEGTISVGTVCIHAGGSCGENKVYNAEGNCVAKDGYFLSKYDEALPCNTRIHVEIKQPQNCSCSNRIAHYPNQQDKETESLYCELEQHLEPYSNCQTATLENDVTIRGFKDNGTPCETAGVQGKCNGWGQCIPQNATACSSNNNCPSGWFCHLGGTYTPDVCEKVQPQQVTINGKTYYYNSKEDLKSWCRPADSQTNCIWGYLSHSGARNWCNAIGKRLLTYNELNAIVDDLKLPIGGYHFQYWVEEGAFDEGIEGKFRRRLDTGRPDGYAWKAGVICADIEE